MCINRRRRLLQSLITKTIILIIFLPNAFMKYGAYSNIPPLRTDILETSSLILLFPSCCSIVDSIVHVSKSGLSFFQSGFLKTGYCCTLKFMLHWTIFSDDVLQQEDDAFGLSSRNFFQEGKIYCYANFFGYANFSIVFGPNFRGQKSPGELPQGVPPVPLWKKASISHWSVFTGDALPLCNVEGKSWQVTLYDFLCNKSFSFTFHVKPQMWLVPGLWHKDFYGKLQSLYIKSMGGTSDSLNLQQFRQHRCLFTGYKDSCSPRHFSLQWFLSQYRIEENRRRKSFSVTLA